MPEHTSAGITGNELTAFQDDRVCLLGDQLCTKGGGTFWYRFPYSAGRLYATSSDTDVENSTLPASFGLDTESTTFTRPVWTAGSSGYGYMAVCSSGQFDTVFIQMVDLNSLGSGTAYLHIADDFTFTAGVELIATFSTGGVSNRIVSTSLGSGNVRYNAAGNGSAFQLSFVPSGGDYTASILPSIIHFQAGQRMQFWRDPHMLEDFHSSFESKGVWAETESGRPTGVVHHAGGRAFNVSWLVDGNGLDPLNDFDNFDSLVQDELDYGANAFIFFPRPSTSPGVAIRGIIEDDSLELTATTDQRKIDFRFVEITPFLSSER